MVGVFVVDLTADEAVCNNCEIFPEVLIFGQWIFVIFLDLFDLSDYLSLSTYRRSVGHMPLGTTSLRSIVKFHHLVLFTTQKTTIGNKNSYV